MKRRRLVGVCSFMITAMALGIGATAWACTEFTSLAAPKSSPPLAEVQVKGTGEVKPRDASKQVEVRWNDVTGPLLATATAQQISSGVGVTVPDVPSGIYFLIAVVDERGIARTSMEVTSADGSAAAPVDFRPLRPSAGDDAALNSGSTDPQLLGVALLAGGLVVLFGGTLAGLALQGRSRRAALVPMHDDLSA